MSSTEQVPTYPALVQGLADRGLVDGRWRRVFEAVPRSGFVPARVWRQLADRCEPVVGADAWLALVNSDEPVVTQLDDGAGGGAGVATSSSSMPSMVARQAAEALAEAGYRPHLRVGDGEQPWPGLGPVDRLIATCAVRHVPYALLRQVRPGGVLVAPLAREFWSGALVQLRVQGDGTATGPFRGGATYTPMRSHRAPDLHEVHGKGRARAAGLDPARLLDLGFALYAGARLPGVRLIHQNTPNGVQVWATREDGGATTAATGEEVWQYGPGFLWEEIEQTWWEYETVGRPDAEQFGLTVTDRGQQVWLRDPHEVIRPARR